MKVWERRLMKDFKVAPVASEDDEDMYALPPENENSLARFRRVARMAMLETGINRWRQVVKGAQIASQIGHCHNRNSLKKQQNLQRAMEEAKRLAAKSPENVSRSTTPIILPDMTGSDILHLVTGEPTPQKKKVALSPNVTVMELNPSTLSATAPIISIQPPPPNLKRDWLMNQWLHKSSNPMESSIQQEADLINLDSSKESPIPTIKGSHISSSSSSLERILGGNLDHVSEEPHCSQDSSHEQIQDSPSKKSLKSEDSLESLGSLKLSTIEPPDEPFPRPSSPLPGYYKDPLNIKYPSEEEETDIEKNEDIQSKYEIEETLQKYKVPDITFDEINNPLIEDTGDKNMSEIIPPDESIKKEEETKLCVSPPPQTELSTAKSPATTPMTQRNIHRIHDTRRVQPKYGWL